MSPDKERLLSIFTIYENPRDYPGRFVVRETRVGPGGTMEISPVAMVVTKSLARARGALPPGLVRLDRSPGDDECIREIWL